MWPGALPVIPGFDCAAASLPARGVGGDFYDVFPDSVQQVRRVQRVHRGRCCWATRPAKASPRDWSPPPCRRASIPRLALAQLDPEALMAAVDRDVYATTDGARYATGDLRCARRVVPPASGRQRRSSRDAAVASPSRSRDAARCHRPCARSDRVRHLRVAHDFSHAGAILVAFTDGASEAMSEAGEEFGDETLVQLLIEQAPGAPPSASSPWLPLRPG